MKTRSRITYATLAGILLSGATFAETSPAPDSPVTQAQLNALYKRIEQLEKLLAENNITPHADDAVAAAPQAATPATTQAPTKETVATTESKVAALSDRVDKLENPTAIKVGALTIKPYGYIKLDAAYNSQKPNPTAGDFSLFTQPKVAGKSDSQTDLSARDSRWGLDLALPEERGIKTTAKVEGDFIVNGTETAYGVRLRHAYADFAFSDGWSVRAGHDWDAFFNVAPITVDAGFLGDSGNLYSRRAQLKLTKVTEVGDGSTLTAKIALANTSSGDLDGLGQDDGLDSATPTVEGIVAFDTLLLSSKPTKLSIGGQFGTETLDAAGNPDAKDYESRLLVAGLYFPLSDMIALQGNLWTGRNLDGWLGGIGQGINTTLLESVSASGGWAQVVYTPNAVWNLNLGYGLDNPEDDDLNIGGRAKNERLFFNVFYKLTKAITLSTEYSIIKTDYKGAADATNNRVQFTTKYQF